jgi:chlorobactene glucosyltransferase
MTPPAFAPSMAFPIFSALPLSDTFAAAIGIGWALLVAFLIYRAVRQYGKYELLSARSAPQPAPLVRVIVPARNEEVGIEGCIGSLLAQDYPRDRIRLTVVDDGSTDATASIAGKLAAADDRLRVLSGEPLPTGWAGKPHACWQAANDAAELDETQPDSYLCFIDADTVSEPALISSAVSLAESRGFDMLSLEPFQLLVTPGERLVLPAGFFLLAFTQDLGRVNDPDSSEATANGQFILIRRKIYDTIGGHSSVRAELSEDSALAKIVKGRGNRLGLIGAEALIRTRMFRGFAAVWNGLGRSASETVGGPGWAILFSCAAIVLALMAVTAPLLTTIVLGRDPGDALAICGCAAAWAGTLAMLGVHIGAANHFRIPLYYGLLFPFGYILAAAVGFNSASRHLRGEVAWKGRIYSPSEASA